MIKQQDLVKDEILVSQYQGGGKFSFSVETSKFSYLADEPIDSGGNDLGMNPYEFLLSSIATCKAMTLNFYAKHKGIDLGRFQVKVSGKKDKTAGLQESIYNITTELFFYDIKDESMINKLKEIAEKCPVHKTLQGKVNFETIVKVD